MSKRDAVNSFILSGNLFCFLLLLDFIYTLYTKVVIDQPGTYTSIMGLTMTQEVTEDYFATAFGVEPRIIFSYIIVLLAAVIFILLKKRRQNVSTN